MVLKGHEIDQAEIVIRRAANGVVAAIPQFGLFTHADTVEAALGLLDDKKKALAKDFAAFGSISTRPVTLASERRGGLGPELLRFTLKTVIVLVPLAAIVVIGSLALQGAAESAVSRLETRLSGFRTAGGRNFGEKLEREIARAANPAGDLPPETKQKILADLRTIGDRWRPFVVEVHRALSVEPDSAAAVPPACK
jgi:hypothetical protein